MFENIVEQIEGIPAKIAGRLSAEMERIMHATKQDVLDAIGEMKSDFTKQIDDVKADFTKQIADLKAAPAADAEAEGSDFDEILGAVKGAAPAAASGAASSVSALASTSATNAAITGATASGDVTVPAGEGATGTGFDSILAASTTDTKPASVAAQMPESTLAAHGGITDENPNITAETGNPGAPVAGVTGT